MKKLKKFSIPLVSAAVWLACFMTYLLIAMPAEYASTKEELLSGSNRWVQCGGDIFHSTTDGWYCDFYEPTKLLWGIVLLGVVAFLTAIVSLTIVLWTQKQK